jgi:hypothetical protein
MSVLELDAPAAEAKRVTHTDLRKASTLLGRLDRKADHARYVNEGPVSEAELRSAYALLREAWRQVGEDDADPFVQEMILKGRAPVAGGATGRGGMSFAHNLPAAGSYLMNPAEFAKWTERNDMPLENRDLTGLGASPIQQRISNVGIMSGLRLIFKGSLVVSGAGTVASTYQWPYNLIKRYQLNVNGSTGIQSCEGLDLRVRHQRIYRNPRDTITTAPAIAATTGDPSPGTIANGTYPIVIVWDIPVPHDNFTLVGSIYAQSDQTYLSQQITPGALAELFSASGGSTAVLTGTFSTEMTFYDIPTVNYQQGQKVVLPDLRWLHGYFATDQAFANTGEVTFPMIRAAGQLLTYAIYLDNGGAAQIALTVLSALRFQYGGNRQPRNYRPVEQLLWENQHNYNGLLQPGYAMLDFEADAPERDLVYPKGVTEIGVVATIPTGTTINANAHGHFVEETLFAGA